MARPLKIGLDYFPLDTGLDEKFELLEAKHGIIGYGIVLKLYQKVYREHGYFYPWGESEQLLFCKWVNVDINTVNVIINDSIKYGIFDEKMASKGLLTSTGIQKRFIEASKRRMQLSLYKDILLVNVNIIPVNVGKNTRTVEYLQYFVRNNPQIKLNKIKLNKSKVNTGETPSAEPSVPAPVDPLYSKIKTAFETVFGKFPDYAREGSAIKRIIKFTEGDEAMAARIITTFYGLTKSQDKYWSGQPFLPSILSSGGIWPRVLVESQKTEATQNADWYDQYAPVQAKDGVA